MVTGGLSFESEIQILRKWFKLILQPHYDAFLPGTLCDSMRSHCMFLRCSSALIFSHLVLKHKTACMKTAVTPTIKDEMHGCVSSITRVYYHLNLRLLPPIFA